MYQIQQQPGVKGRKPQKDPAKSEALEEAASNSVVRIGVIR